MNLYDRVVKEEREEAERLKEAHLTLCRERSEIMTEYVMRDSMGKQFRNAIHHNRLHAALRKHKRLVVMWPPGFGKTRQLISLMLHILGRNTDADYTDKPKPMYCGAIIGSNQGNAAKALRVVRDMIMNSKELHEVWPNLAPITGEHELWTNTAITVTRPPGLSDSDPSIQALGANGNLVGSRLQFAILDDTVTFENTRTPEQRDTYWEWFKSTLMTRLDEDGLIVILTNSWHPEDAPHRLIEEEGWPALVEPAILENGEALWKEQFPVDKVLAKIEELGEIEGPRKMLHKSRDEASMRFTMKMVGTALERGRGVGTYAEYSAPNGYSIYTGVDLAVSQTRRRTAGRFTGETVFFTILKHPSKVRQVLDVRAGRWDAARIVSEAIDIYRCFSSILVVENNAAQDLFVQLMRAMCPHLPIIPYTTGSDAAHPEFGMEKMGVEMQNGLWIIPSDNMRRPTGQIYTWVQELYDYSPNKHVGDRARAAMFAWEGARRHETKTRGMKLKLFNR
jgi:hypothetical protein